MKKFVLYFYGTEHLWEDANGDLYGYLMKDGLESIQVDLLDDESDLIIENEELDLDDVNYEDVRCVEYNTDAPVVDSYSSDDCPYAYDIEIDKEFKDKDECLKYITSHLTICHGIVKINGNVEWVRLISDVKFNGIKLEYEPC